jgi:hypothetical protein
MSSKTMRLGNPDNGEHEDLWYCCDQLVVAATDEETGEYAFVCAECGQHRKAIVTEERVETTLPTPPPTIRGGKVHRRRLASRTVTVQKYRPV